MLSTKEKYTFERSNLDILGDNYNTEVDSFGYAHNPPDLSIYIKG